MAHLAITHGTRHMVQWLKVTGLYDRTSFLSPEESPLLSIRMNAGLRHFRFFLSYQTQILPTGLPYDCFFDDLVYVPHY